MAGLQSRKARESLTHLIISKERDNAQAKWGLETRSLPDSGQSRTWAERDVFLISG